MLKELSRRLQHCNDIAVRINNANDSQLQELKTQLALQMGKPVGLNTMDIPAAISTLGVIVSLLFRSYGWATAYSPHSISRQKRYLCG